MQIFNRKTTVSLATALGLVFGAAQAKAEEFVNILTGGTSGVYYPLGVAMEKFIPAFLMCVLRFRRRRHPLRISISSTAAAAKWRSRWAIPA